MPTKARSTGTGGKSWKQAAPAEVVVITGGEGLLVDRAIERIVQAAKRAHDELEVTRVEAASYQPGTLARLASPSLFEEHRVVILVGAAEANETAVTETLAYLSDPQPDVVFIVCHGGGVRAKKLADTAKKVEGAIWVDCQPLKRDNDLLGFIADEFAAAKRTISSKAAQLLVDAFGSDLRELASSSAQLLADIPGDIDVEHVRTYYGGRAEASGFEVADAVVARDGGRALLTLRQALESGVDPIPMLAAIASKLRGLAKVSVASGPTAQVAKELGMAPWMIEQARRNLRDWPPADLARTIMEIGAADVALKGGVEIAGRVKGGTQDTVYTMERLVLRACGAI